MTVFHTGRYPQLDRFLASQHSLILTCPDLHFLIGSSLTTDKSRTILKLIATATISIADHLNPEAKLAIATLNFAFSFSTGLGVKFARQTTPTRERSIRRSFPRCIRY
ncbi:MAG: hypothetical protein J7642_19140 [Cyanobacteria bacterium SBC]|nr:hypothetical protein [Cyanobacteria bacterium SBC]